MLYVTIKNDFCHDYSYEHQDARATTDYTQSFTEVKDFGEVKSFRHEHSRFLSGESKVYIETKSLILNN